MLAFNLRARVLARFETLSSHARARRARAECWPGQARFSIFSCEPPPAKSRGQRRPEHTAHNFVMAPCPVCLDEPVDPVTLDCAHQLCRACLNQLEDRSRPTPLSQRCPTCRRPLPRVAKASCPRRTPRRPPQRPPCIFCRRGIALRCRRGVFSYTSACGRGASGRAGTSSHNILYEYTGIIN